MHHASSRNLQAENDEESGSSGADDDDLLRHTRVNDEEASGPVVHTIPSEGYRIFNLRPPTPAPPVCDPTPSYVSFTPPVFSDTDAWRFDNAFTRVTTYTLKNWGTLMLAFVPIGVLAPVLGWGDSAVFVLNCLAVIPLADVLCRATDDVSGFMGDTLGALLNITMGNATELVILHALLQRQYMIVRTSLLGSIIVNMLLVLGLAIFTGELQQRGQAYNVLATRVAAGLLCLTTVSLLVPSTLKTVEDDLFQKRDVLTLSRAISMVLIVTYFIYLWTQNKSSKYSYNTLIELEDDDQDIPEMLESVELNRPGSRHRRTFSYPRTPSGPITPQAWSTPSGPIEPRELEAIHQLAGLRLFFDPILPHSLTRLDTAIEFVKTLPWVPKVVPIALLLTATGLIALCAGHLVDSIDHFVAHSPVSKTMIGLIILPIVGNTAELISGIMFAWRKQMDLAFAISIGSAIQIALFVAPLVVLLGWGMDREMSLQFTMFEAISLVASTALFFSLVFDDRCSGLKGACLVAGYTVIGLASYFILSPE